MHSPCMLLSDHARELARREGKRGVLLGPWVEWEVTSLDSKVRRTLGTVLLGHEPSC